VVGVTTHTIGEAARRSGFAPATLRYYDDLGLVRPNTRSSAGYRRYSERDLERLRFVGRAKQLGCSLDEVADLLIAWDGGECGPVQQRLQALVQTKIADARERLVELAGLLADLHRAVAGLDRHRPSGPCDDACGCVVEPAESVDAASSAPPLVLVRGPGADDPPIACSLPPAALPERLAAFRALAEAARGREPIDRGVRLELGDADLGALAELLRHEQTCCTFWEFAITVDARGVGVEVRGPDGTGALVDALFGVSAWRPRRAQ
jgi:MerR family transcriptional regulator, copper efflux regulator